MTTIAGTIEVPLRAHPEIKVLIDEDMKHLQELGSFHFSTNDNYIWLCRKPLAWHILPPKAGFVIDHINQNKLDNRRANLRYATRRVNALNSKHRANNTSGIKGVHKRSDSGKWKVYIQLKKYHKYTIGTFEDFFEACCARKSAEVKFL